MWSLSVGFRKALAGNPEVLKKAQFPFIGTFSIQPELRYHFMDQILQFYADSPNETVKKSLESLVPFAIDKLSEGLSYDDSAAYFLALGRAYDLEADMYPDQTQEFHLKAEVQFKKALELYPDNQKTMYVYAINLAHQNKFDDALTMLQQTLAVDPRVAESHYYLGVILFYQDNSVNAVSSLENIEYALDHDMNPLATFTKAAYQRLLVIFYDRGDLPHLTTVLSRLVLINPDQAEQYKKVLDYIKTYNQMPILSLQG